jgi:hypothetical protein
VIGKEMFNLYGFNLGRAITIAVPSGSFNVSKGVELNINNFEEIESKTLEVESLTTMDKGVSNIFKVYPQLFDWLNLLDMNVLIILILSIDF